MVRFKNRYFVSQVIWHDGAIDDTVTESLVTSSLRESIHLNYGDVGLSRALMSLQVKYLNSITGVCVLRCSREDHQDILSAMTLVKEVRRRRVSVQLLHMGGTIRSCQQAALKSEESHLRKLQAEPEVRLTLSQLQQAKASSSRIHLLDP